MTEKNGNKRMGDLLINDALNHIVSLCYPHAHCPICLSAKIFAFSFILNVQQEKYVNHEFKKRAEHIADGLFLFLQRRPTSAVYIILPQLDGLVHDHLFATGLLKEGNGYPVWTSRATAPGKKCKNLRDAIMEGVRNEHSRLGKTKQLVKYDDKLLAPIKKLRDDLIHGSITQIPEHKAVDVIQLLVALHHDLELYEVTDT